MTAPGYRVRRAIVDDLEQLRALWASMQLPVADLEKRLREFQVAESPSGEPLGVLGLEVIGRHGRLHSEAFFDFAQADALRQSLWQRMVSLAANLGVARLWTQEVAPFWRQTGFETAGPEILKKLPAAWVATTGSWFTIQLRNEEALEQALDKEFARFKIVESAHTARTLRTGKFLKNVSTALAVILAIVVVILCVYMLTKRGAISPH